MQTDTTTLHQQNQVPVIARAGCVDALTPNQQRASYAQGALEASLHHDADDPCGVLDLLSDLMHLCHEQGYDFAELLRIATDNFNAEVMDAELSGRAA